MDYYIDKNNIRELCRVVSEDLDVPLDTLIVDYDLTKFGALVLLSFLLSCTYKISKYVFDAMF